MHEFPKKPCSASGLDKLIKVIEKCTNFYFGTEKLPPKFYELISIVKKNWVSWPPNRFSV